MKEGNCETCGHWDDNLVDGMCSECTDKYVDHGQSNHIIGIAGPAHCGKDAAADYLLKHLTNYKKASFADPMKTMLKVGLGLTDNQLYGDQKEKIDSRYGWSPRHMMQTIGTEWGRQMIDPDIWVKAMEHHVAACTIIPDIRFENEAAFVRERGKLIHIVGRERGIESNHLSETGVEITSDDIIIINDGSLNDLYKQLQVIAECYSNS